MAWPWSCVAAVGTSPKNCWALGDSWPQKEILDHFLKYQANVHQSMSWDIYHHLEMIIYHLSSSIIIYPKTALLWAPRRARSRSVQLPHHLSWKIRSPRSPRHPRKRNLRPWQRKAKYQEQIDTRETIRSWARTVTSFFQTVIEATGRWRIVKNSFHLRGNGIFVSTMQVRCFHNAIICNCMHHGRWSCYLSPRR